MSSSQITAVFEDTHETHIPGSITTVFLKLVDFHCDPVYFQGNYAASGDKMSDDEDEMMEDGDDMFDEHYSGDKMEDKLEYTSENNLKEGIKMEKRTGSEDEEEEDDVMGSAGQLYMIL